VNTILRLSDCVPNFVVKREENPKKGRSLGDAGQLYYNPHFGIRLMLYKQIYQTNLPPRGSRESILSLACTLIELRLLTWPVQARIAAERSQLSNPFAIYILALP
jgi:hypothetical protein